MAQGDMRGRQGLQRGIVPCMSTAAGGRRHSALEQGMQSLTQERDQGPAAGLQTDASSQARPGPTLTENL